MIRSVLLAVVLLSVALALAAPVVSPVHLSYVTSDSMAPTLEPTDGYVLVPAGTIEPGDIVTYDSPERAGLVTHRVAAVTAVGLVTRGDANPSTDQAAGYPPVQRDDVVGAVLTLGGEPVVVPRLGAGIALVEAYWYLVVGVLVGLGLIDVTRTSSSRRRMRAVVVRGRDVVFPAAIVAVLVGVALVSMAAVGQTQTYQVVETETAGPSQLTVGQIHTETVNLQLARTSMTHVVYDTEGMEFVSVASTDAASAPRPASGDPAGRIWDRFYSTSSRTVTVSVPPQEALGTHRTRLSVSPYPATLPYGVVAALHEVHPLVAALSTVLVVVGSFSALYWLLVDTATPLRGSRSRRLHHLGRRR
ncbi:signal peptidase I [Salinigranum halophilum]|uniref:signal peptidase I n=1 Tax=Salinigranum halophilum TaxID=2565931 RepID=UPI00115EEA0B|nr:signal peptidase I [Salinigranum halophilum]